MRSVLRVLVRRYEKLDARMTSKGKCGCVYIIVCFQYMIRKRYDPVRLCQREIQISEERFQIHVFHCQTKCGNIDIVFRLNQNYIIGNWKDSDNIFCKKRIVYMVIELIDNRTIEGGSYSPLL